MIVTDAQWRTSTLASFTIQDAMMPAQGVGEIVTVAGVVPAGYNGAYPLLVKSDGLLVVQIVADPGAYISGGTIT